MTIKPIDLDDFDDDAPRPVKPSRDSSSAAARPASAVSLPSRPSSPNIAFLYPTTPGWTTPLMRRIRHSMRTAFISVCRSCPMAKGVRSGMRHTSTGTPRVMWS